MKRATSILYENATLTTLKPLFSWGLAPGPACYVIEVSQSNGFTTTYTFTVTTCLFIPPYDLASRAFFAWIKTVDAPANSSTRSISASDLPLQINQFIATAPMPIWSHAGWTTNFLVAIYTNDAFTGIPVWSSHMLTGRDANITVDKPILDGLYYARIRAKKPDGLAWGTEITKSFVVA